MILFPKNHLNDLEKRFEYAHAIFVTECASLYKRMVRIGESNLENFAILQKLTNANEFIKKEHDEKARTTLEALKQLLQSKNNKAFEALLSPSKRIMTDFERAVKEFLFELQELLKPEQESKQLISKIKEEARLLRQSYHQKLDRLTLVEVPLTVVFKSFEDYLIKLDNKMDIGDHEEIKIMVTKLDQFINQLNTKLTELPNLCGLIDTVLPSKMNAALEEFDRLTKLQYPLHHLMIRDTLNKFDQEIQTFKQQLQQLKTQGIDERLQAMIVKIESFYPLFEKEKEAKIYSEKEYEVTYKEVNAVERKFSKLNNTIPEYKKVYVIGEESLSQVSIIQKLISELNMTKRGLDTLVLSSTPQPFSLQVARLTSLKENTLKAHQLMDDFLLYLSNLKSEAEQAYQAAQSYFHRFKQAEHELSLLNHPEKEKSYQPIFVQYYQTIVSTLEALQLKPINMVVMNQNLSLLKTESENFLNALSQTLKVASLAEQTILIANRDRQRLNDYHRILSLAEQSFFEGKYEKAYLEAGNLIKKIQQQKSK
jgi:septation ring formation regulator EzrA